jgi:hypothetical protein
VESVKEILEREGVHGSEDLDIHDSFHYDGGDAYDDLAIEKVYEDTLSVEQYFTQRMDRMSAPEVRFDISDYDDWEIVEYTDHSSWEMTEYGRMQIHRTKDEIGEAEREFVERWDEALKRQFPADEVVDRGENR